MGSCNAFGEVYESAPDVAAVYTIIMLHGLGDTGMGWQPVAQQIKVPGARWIFPTAPTRPITLNMGMPMPGWFDLESLDFPTLCNAKSEEDIPEGLHDVAGIDESVDYILNLIDQEINQRNIPPQNIVIGGFSQGGHIAGKVAVRCRHKLAGCLMLSTWLDPW